jgi:putative endonuclease
MLMNKGRTVIYTGVTAALKKRVQQHRDGTGAVFTRKYKCHILVYYETFPDMQQAIAREKYIKNRSRAWKLDLIRAINPKLKDIEL